MVTRPPSPRALFLIRILHPMDASTSLLLPTEPHNDLMFRLTAVASIPRPLNTIFGTFSIAPDPFYCSYFAHVLTRLDSDLLFANFL